VWAIVSSQRPTTRSRPCRSRTYCRGGSTQAGCGRTKGRPWASSRPVKSARRPTWLALELALPDLFLLDLVGSAVCRVLEGPLLHVVGEDESAVLAAVRKRGFLTCRRSSGARYPWLFSASTSPCIHARATRRNRAGYSTCQAAGNPDPSRVRRPSYRPTASGAALATADAPSARMTT
jgi:hypothetical protein